MIIFLILGTILFGPIFIALFGVISIIAFPFAFALYWVFRYFMSTSKEEKANNKGIILYGLSSWMALLAIITIVPDMIKINSNIQKCNTAITKLGMANDKMNFNTKTMVCSYTSSTWSIVDVSIK